MCRDFAAILVAWGLRAYGGDPGMIGLEPTLEEHIANLVAVFREVRRVLRPDGTVWLNYGDAYADGRTGSRQKEKNGEKQTTNRGSVTVDHRPVPIGLKPKDLMLLPARVALALQADGWWVRSEIVWAKPNPMPESVTDRPTSAHEKVFLLTKQAHYFYDSEAVRTPSTGVPKMTDGWDTGAGSHGTVHWNGREKGRPTELAPRNGGRREYRNGMEQSHMGAMPKAEQQANGANLRNVWTIPTHGYSEAHFATFPPALVEPCIKACTSEKGCCVKCGAPWRRVVEAQGGTVGQSWHDHSADLKRGQQAAYSGGVGNADNGNGKYSRQTTGWQPTCECEAETRPCVVLDPFAGAGTVGLVADRLGRDAVLIEINAEYAEMARHRIEADAPLFAAVS